MTNDIKMGDVWFVEFPLEDNPTEFRNRPVVVLDVDKLEVLSVKVTKHNPRPDDPYDTPIVYWHEANLHFPSTARISKVMKLSKDSFLFKIGDIDQRDLDTIANLYMDFIQKHTRINK